MKSVALVACFALGCFGYDPGAKKWAYVGDSVLIAGGAAAIAADLATRPGTCTAEGCYQPAIDGGLVAGAMLVASGVVGMIFNATRTPVKTSR